MAYSTGKTKHPCWAEFNCFYKVGNTCSFWQHVEAFLSVLQEKHHKGKSCIVNRVDMYREPCLDITAEEREQGIPDVLGLNLER